MMTIEIFDVGHGACTVVTAPNGRRMMIDCGHDSERPWWPSVNLYGRPLEDLVISNYDEDHVSDLVDVMNRTPPAYITRNPTVTSGDIYRLKMEMGMGRGIERLHKWMRDQGDIATGGPPPDFGPMRRALYYNSYPRDFDDENNLSVVTVVEWSGFRAMFPGDLEVAGWRRLLQNRAFRQELAYLDVFVASHHGRESGCCDEVFDVGRPKVVIISDHDVRFDTQETSGWYCARATGIQVVGCNGPRYLLTTRNDGDITITVGPQRWFAATSR